MKAKVVRKDFSMATEEDAYSLTTSGRGEWLLSGNQRDIFIDPSDSNHLEWLRSWAKAHWLATFKRSLVYGNKLTYHCCCNSFSRRSFVKSAGHPPLLSIGVLQIPGLRNATSHQDLSDWLVEIAKESAKQGAKMMFPSLNRLHLETEEREETTCQPYQEDQSLLSKRTMELEKELNKTRQQILDLKRDNDRLLMSSKNWYDKYHDLLNQGPMTMSILNTPKKYTLNDCCFVED